MGAVPLLRVTEPRLSYARHLAGLNSHSILSAGGCCKAALCLWTKCSLCSLGETCSHFDCTTGCDKLIPAGKLMSPKHLAHPSAPQSAQRATHPGHTPNTAGHWDPGSFTFQGPNVAARLAKGPGHH